MTSLDDNADTIPLASDHAGYPLKERVKAWLQIRGHSVRDLGTNSEESVDYPDFAQQVARAVSNGEHARGVLICGTGLGMSYAANRFPRVRAALCWSEDAAMLSRTHNDANILILPGRLPTADAVEDILSAFLETPFSDEERHQRRLGKIDNRDDDS